MDYKVELSRIVISETNEQQLIVLKEVNGTRTIPIIISIFEAISIDWVINKRPIIRPMTHDLMATLVTELNGTLERVTITKVEQNTFFAELRIFTTSGIKKIDARPSDSIALAVRLNCPLYAHESVFNTHN